MGEMEHGPTAGARQRLTVRACGRDWLVERTADLETLWAAIGEAEFGPDERLPYWAELWPASLLLARWLERRRDDVAGRTCLDLGCGLGLTGIVASSFGARVVGLDYEWPALYFSRVNAELNRVPPPLWVQMDWRAPGFRAGAFERIWGGDIVYETRFFEPLVALFEHCLAPGGRIWLGEPQRSVSRPVWDRLAGLGWRVDKVATEPVPVEGYHVTVNLWELTRGA
jgi:predicted nicotinamide N-methyase